jgi:hypothetical protein
MLYSGKHVCLMTKAISMVSYPSIQIIFEKKKPTRIFGPRKRK